MASIFISYSRADLDAVTNLSQDLGSLEHQVWYDQALTGGQRWWDNILAQIRRADIFIAVMTPDTLESQACKQELHYAFNLHKPLLPVRLSRNVNLNLLPRNLSEIQFVDYCDQDKADLIRMNRALKSLPAAPPLPTVLPDPPPVPLSYLGNLRERVDTPDPLDIKDQIALVFEIKAHFKEHGRAVIEDTRELLKRLGQRHDLFATVAKEIYEVLNAMNKTGSQGVKAEVAKEIDEILDSVNKTESQGVKAEKGHQVPTPAPQARTDATESTARERPLPERIRTGRLLEAKSPPDGKPPSSVAMHKVAGVLSLVLSRTMNKGESWQIDADDHNRLVIAPLSESPKSKIVVTATMRDNASSEKSTALKEMGWKVKDGGFTKGALGAAALYATSGLGALALLSKSVRDYFMSYSATKEWKKPRNDSEVSAIADELRLVLNRLAPDAQRVTLDRCEANSLSGDPS